jgi:antitoxin HicB
MFSYPITIVCNASSMHYQGTCRDFPSIRCIAPTEEGVLSQAQKIIINNIAALILRRLPIPEGSEPEAVEKEIHLPVLIAMKAALHNSLLESGTRRTHLARQLGIHAPQMSRLLDLNHFSRVEMLERALLLSGKHIRLTVHPGRTRNHGSGHS